MLSILRWCGCYYCSEFSSEGKKGFSGLIICPRAARKWWSWAHVSDSITFSLSQHRRRMKGCCLIEFWILLERIWLALFESGDQLWSNQMMLMEEGVMYNNHGGPIYLCRSNRAGRRKIRGATFHPAKGCLLQSSLLCILCGLLSSSPLPLSIWCGLTVPFAKGHPTGEVSGPQGHFQTLSTHEHPHSWHLLFGITKRMPPLYSLLR